MDVSVIVGTYGGREWRELAQDRAIPSANAAGARVVHAHRDTLHEARNAGAQLTDSEWLCFLDADDELSPDYFHHMKRGSADLRAPAVSYVRNGRAIPPYVPQVAGHRHPCTAECVTSGDGNWLVVGTLIRREQFLEAGGWRDWTVYEDFDLWMRALLLGATVEAIPEAVYRAHVRPDSRNRAPEMSVKNSVHRAIVEANLAA